MAREAVVFIRPPKVAGTSISHTLGLQEVIQRKEFQKMENWVQFSHYHYPSLVKEGWVSKDFDRKAFKFAFVRNPFDRAVSTYFYLKNYKMIGADGKRRDRFEASFDTFKDWCQYLAKREFSPVGLYNNRNRSIYNAQWEWLKDVRLDFIGKFETLQESFNDLCKLLGAEPKLLQKMRGSSHDHWSTYYDKETKDIIVDIYSDDFKHLGYNTSI